MTDSTHAESVAALKRVTDVCLIVVSREVLVVMPEDEGGPEQGEGELLGEVNGGTGNGWEGERWWEM